MDSGGRGDLGNIIGNPLETTYFLTNMIFDGTLDRFPNLKICGAHSGGYLPSYLGRTEVACEFRANADCANRKLPSEYLRDQILIDSMIFSEEGTAASGCRSRPQPGGLRLGHPLQLARYDRPDSGRTHAER